eukprot:TRINITY_DN2791_c0_g1_i1.p1 TRINITY_DN2791_c0_g1~~TRINITY_DN2791_c0_g1_i1.p1  ORF type:complete len:547 (+),score=93.25 TRINITY_DN2791_c0_g1_i1:195-1835(+)
MMIRMKCSMLIVLVTLTTLVCTTFSANPPVVKTQCGYIGGSYNANTSVSAFKGIPFASPPIGKLRWKPTQPSSCWSGTLNATSFGKVCMQNGPDPSEMSEDCLFLNVWTQNASAGALLPTLVFIHGGSFVSGAGSYYDQESLVAASKGKVVAVSLNYRLNSFGFLSLKLLSENDPRGVSGNYAILDIVTALQWIQKNIESFGGDPNRITIYGQSSGGTAVLMLLASPYAKGLFQRAITESGSTRVDLSLHDAENQNIPFLAASKCSTVQCIYNLTSLDVLQYTPFDVYPYFNHPTDVDLPIMNLGPGAMLGIVDGDVVPFPLDETLSGDYEFNDVPVIIGTNAQEIDFFPADDLRNYTIAQYNDFIADRFSDWQPSLPDQILSLYNITEYYEGTPQLAYETIASDIHATCGQLLLARAMARSFKSPIYHYVVLYRPSSPVYIYFTQGWPSRYSFHMIELLFMLDLVDYIDPGYVVSPKDAGFGSIVRDYWVEFATNGKLDYWPVMSGMGSYSSLILDVPVSTVRNWRREECEYWNANGFYPWNWNS